MRPATDFLSVSDAAPGRGAAGLHAAQIGPSLALGGYLGSEQRIVQNDEAEADTGDSGLPQPAGGQ